MTTLLLSLLLVAAPAGPAKGSGEVEALRRFMDMSVDNFARIERVEGRFRYGSYGTPLEEAPTYRFEATSPLRLPGFDDAGALTLERVPDAEDDALEQDPQGVPHQLALNYMTVEPDELGRLSLVGRDGPLLLVRHESDERITSTSKIDPAANYLTRDVVLEIRDTLTLRWSDIEYAEVAPGVFYPIRGRHTQQLAGDEELVQWEFEVDPATLVVEVTPDRPTLGPTILLGVVLATFAVLVAGVVTGIVRR